MPAKPAINRKSVVDQVYGKLRASILSGEIAQGSRIVELQVARRLGTSRAPVREAINRLLQAGLVETRPHHGPSVITMTHAQVAKLYRLRTAVECTAIEEIMRQASPRLDRLTDCIHRMTTIARQPREAALRRFVEADLRFHETLWAMSGNEYIQRVGMLIGDQVQMALAIDDARSDDLAWTAASHTRLVEAIRDRDVEAAVAMMRQHLRFPEDPAKP